MSTSPFRRDPQRGEILLVPISDNRFAYLLMLSSCRAWLLDFTTSSPSQKESLFTRSTFKMPLSFSGKFPKRLITAGKLELTDIETQSPPTVLKQSPEVQRNKGGPTPYEVFMSLAPNKWVTEEEAKSYFPYVDLTPEKGEVEEFIRQRLPELRHLEVAPEDRWSPPKVKEPEGVEKGPVLMEVHFQCEPEELGMEADEIAEVLGDDVWLQDLGSMMTMDSGGEDSRFEVILEVKRHRLKAALTQIRKTLKRLKAPATTRIIEVADTGPIEHPLIARLKGK